MNSTTTQEIQAQLSGLNRTSSQWTNTRDSDAAKKKGVDNYLKWFKERHITIKLKTNGIWVIDPNELGAKEKTIEKACLFCNKRDSSLFDSKYFFVVSDDFPIRCGHSLIIPFRHVEQLTDLTRDEFSDIFFVIQEMVTRIKLHYAANDYNIGINNGVVAGQTIPHLHIHLIPRYVGDVQDPRGGIRNFLPNPLTKYQP